MQLKNGEETLTLQFDVTRSSGAVEDSFLLTGFLRSFLWMESPRNDRASLSHRPAFADAHGYDEATHDFSPFLVGEYRPLSLRTTRSGQKATLYSALSRGRRCLVILASDCTVNHNKLVPDD